MKDAWKGVMSTEETEEFGALEIAIEHTKQALNALSVRRAKIRNRLVMRINWRKNHVGDK